MMPLLLALLVQDSVQRSTMTIERYAKRDDRVSVETGDLLIRPGEALAYRSRTQRILIRDGKAYERKGAERKVTAWDLAKPENFQPLDLWRLDARAIRERFQEVDDRAAATRELPPSVLAADGTPLPPVAVNPGAESLARVDGADRAEGCARVVLVPRDGRLRSRITSIRLSVDRATGRILHAVVDAPASVITLTLGDSPETAAPDAAAFDWDFSTLKVEDR